jgi:hypothetical protein
MAFDWDDHQLVLPTALVEPVVTGGWMALSTDDVLYLELEPVPVKKLMGMNRGQVSNWHARNDANEFWRKRVKAAGEDWEAYHRADLPRYARARAVVTFSYGNLHHRDSHNLGPTAKFIVDGLMDIGVIVDDDDELFMGPDIRRGLDRRLGQHLAQVIVKVCPLAADEYTWWIE